MELRSLAIQGLQVERSETNWLKKGQKEGKQSHSWENLTSAFMETTDRSKDLWGHAMNPKSPPSSSEFPAKAPLDLPSVIGLKDLGHRQFQSQQKNKQAQDAYKKVLDWADLLFWMEVWG